MLSHSDAETYSVRLLVWTREQFSRVDFWTVTLMWKNGQNETEHSTWMLLRTGKTVHRWWSELSVVRSEDEAERSRWRVCMFETHCNKDVGYWTMEAPVQFVLSMSGGTHPSRELVGVWSERRRTAGRRPLAPKTAIQSRRLCPGSSDAADRTSSATLTTLPTCHHRHRRHRRRPCGNKGQRSHQRQQKKSLFLRALIL